MEKSLKNGLVGVKQRSCISSAYCRWIENKGADMSDDRGHEQHELIEQTGLGESHAELFRSRFHGAIAVITGGAWGLGMNKGRRMGGSGGRGGVTDGKARGWDT